MIPKALLPKKDGKVYPNTVDNANLLKGDHKDQYVLSERALRTMNYDTKIIKISWKREKAFKEFNMVNIKPSFWIFN